MSVLPNHRSYGPGGGMAMSNFGICIRAGLAKMTHACGNQVTASGEGKRTRYHCENCERDLSAHALAGCGLHFHDLRRSQQQFRPSEGSGLLTNGKRLRPSYRPSWCREGESNPHAPLRASDFKSDASANSAIPAMWMQPLSILDGYGFTRLVIAHPPPISNDNACLEKLRRWHPERPPDCF